MVVVGVSGTKTVGVTVAVGEATAGDAAGLAAGEAEAMPIGSDRTVEVGVTSTVGLAAGDKADGAVDTGVTLIGAVAVIAGLAVAAGVTTVGGTRTVGVAIGANVGISVGTIDSASGLELSREKPPLGGVHWAIGWLDPPASDPTAAPTPTVAMMARTTTMKRVFPTAELHPTQVTASFAVPRQRA